MNDSSLLQAQSSHLSLLLLGNNFFLCNFFSILAMSGSLTIDLFPDRRTRPAGFGRRRIAGYRTIRRCCRALLFLGFCGGTRVGRGEGDTWIPGCGSSLGGGRWMARAATNGSERWRGSEACSPRPAGGDDHMAPASVRPPVPSPSPSPSVSRKAPPNKCLAVRGARARLCKLQRQANSAPPYPVGVPST